VQGNGFCGARLQTCTNYKGLLLPLVQVVKVFVHVPNTTFVRVGIRRPLYGACVRFTIFASRFDIIVTKVVNLLVTFAVKHDFAKLRKVVFLHHVNAVDKVHKASVYSAVLTFEVLPITQEICLFHNVYF
jgi:hypothetical protein